MRREVLFLFFSLTPYSDYASDIFMITTVIHHFIAMQNRDLVTSFAGNPFV